MILWELIWGFLKVGMFSFGGAYGAIPLIRDVVLSSGWMTDDILTNMIAVSESTPGPIMVNLATYVGSRQAGLPGAILATAAVVLPSFLIILLVTALLSKVLKNKYVQAALGGMKPCMIGIVAATGVYMIANTCFSVQETGKPDVTAIVLTALLSLVYFGSRKVRKKGISPILLIAAAAVCGVIAYGL